MIENENRVQSCSYAWLPIATTMFRCEADGFLPAIDHDGPMLCKKCVRFRIASTSAQCLRRCSNRIKPYTNVFIGILTQDCFNFRIDLCTTMDNRMLLHALSLVGLLSVLPRLLLQGAAPCPLFVTPCPFEKAEMTPCPFDFFFF